MSSFFRHPAAMRREMAEARRKISSLLNMDFLSLICLNDLDELASLASKLQKDPTLTAEQLVKLMFIQEIPSSCKVFLENRGVMEQADKFFTALEDKKAKLTSLKQEFIDFKQEATNLQSEVDSNTLIVQDIDNQIAQLKAQPLRKDPTLTAKQLVKLKSIQEIPSSCKVFLENRGVMEQADEFFTALEDKKAKFTSMEQEFSDLKQEVTNLQSEVDSNTLIVQDINNQIAQLEARRVELTRQINGMKRDQDKFTHIQELVVNSLKKVFHEVRLANARIPEWELKKRDAVRRETEILAKFARVKGFSF